jgi:hypothetical protein
LIATLPGVVSSASINQSTDRSNDGAASHTLYQYPKHPADSQHLR